MVAILGPNGHPLTTNGHSKPRRELTAAFQLANGTPRRKSAAINATYDAARESTDFANYWANADRLDADSANSKTVRSKLVSRSRYEVGNNGYVDGMVQTYATDLVGVGPSLRMTTPDQEFNQRVEAAWKKWAKTIQLRRKLWCMAHAKVQDGESFAIIRANPKLRTPISLDIVLIETEQCQSPQLPHNELGRIDGIAFDEFGNVDYYEVLKAHPGGSFTGSYLSAPEQIPARFMLHWFLMRRPGQHRAVPEFRSTLQVGAASRRWREATVAAAETAADFAALIHTDQPANDEDGEIIPMTETEINKRMMVALPNSYTATQMKAEHPNATYEAFHKSQINEQARPKSMPYNKAACDSSSYNFASGRLDHITYYSGIDVEREDANDLAMDPLFAVWWEEASIALGWNVDPNEPGDHQWDWPEHEVADEESRAKARDVSLSNGSLSYSEAASEDGIDFEERLQKMAMDYGRTVDEMRELLLMNSFSKAFMAQAQLAFGEQSKKKQAT